MSTPSDEVRSQWRKSSYSTNGGDCVELKLSHDGERVVVRDSKDPDGPRLRFTRSELHAFVRAAKAGEFDDLT
jgi:hypothetical protein